MLSARLSFCFSLLVAFAVYTGSANAQSSGATTLCGGTAASYANPAAGCSDHLEINTLAGGNVFDWDMFEGSTESIGLSILGAIPGHPPGYGTVLWTPQAAGFLIEPAGQPVEPGENPIYLPGTNDIVSDVFMTDGVHQALFFASDGDPLFATWVNDALGLARLFTLEETGQPQDITPYFGGASPNQVILSSDIVPEPGTALLLGAGLVGIAVRRRAKI